MRPSYNNMLGRLLDAAPTGKSRAARIARLWAEGALYASCALLIADGLGVPQSGFFAVFLGAAGLTARFEEILDENRRDIWERRRGSLRANARSTAHLLALFLGSFSAFLTAALWMGEARMHGAFGFVLDAAHLGHDTILTRPFASAPGLFIHNGLVLLVFMALSLIYRSYGALLALTWNACIWGLVLAFLVRRGMAGSGTTPAFFVAVSVGAVLPHLLLEATAYLVGSLAAIFLAKGILKYSPGERAFRQVMGAVATLTLVAVGCLLAGAIVEASLPHAILGLIER